MEEHSRTTNTNKTTPSNSEVIHSAKVILDAAKSSFGGNNNNENIDKAKVADAAADILGAASHYGKLDDKSYGKIIDKAEDYLHKYNSSHSSTTGPATAHNVSGESHDSGGGKKDHGHSSGGGYGEYIKMAQGFMNKQNHDNQGDNEKGDHQHVNSSHAHNQNHHHSSVGQGVGHDHGDNGGHGHGHSGAGGYGEYVKFAQDILKK